MLFDFLKFVVAGVLVISIPKISYWCPSMSGVIGAMPAVSFLCLLSICFKNGNSYEAVNYSKTAAFGMVLGCLFYLGIHCALKKGINIPGAIGIGAGIWIVATMIYLTYLPNMPTTHLGGKPELKKHDKTPMINTSPRARRKPNNKDARFQGGRFLP